MKKLQVLYPEIKIGHHEKGVTVILGSFSKQFANDPTFEEVVDSLPSPGILNTIRKTFPNVSMDLYGTTLTIKQGGFSQTYEMEDGVEKIINTTITDAFERSNPSVAWRMNDTHIVGEGYALARRHIAYDLDNCKIPFINTTFPTGAVRSTDANHVAYHLISPIGIRRVAETYAEGEKKYGSFQWEKGMPIGDILNHGLNHVFLYLNGDRSEDHLAHAAWNLMAAMHMEETHPNIEHNLRPGKNPTPLPCEQGNRSYHAS